MHSQLLIFDIPLWLILCTDEDEQGSCKSLDEKQTKQELEEDYESLKQILVLAATLKCPHQVNIKTRDHIFSITFLSQTKF